MLMLAGMMDTFPWFPWWAWIPILGTVAWTIQSVVHMNHKHRERIEMIRQGMDPRDYGKK